MKLSMIPLLAMLAAPVAAQEHAHQPLSTREAFIEVGKRWAGPALQGWAAQAALDDLEAAFDAAQLLEADAYAAHLKETFSVELRPGSAQDTVTALRQFKRLRTLPHAHREPPRQEPEARVEEPAPVEEAPAPDLERHAHEAEAAGFHVGLRVEAVEYGVHERDNHYLPVPSLHDHGSGLQVDLAPDAYGLRGTMRLGANSRLSGGFQLFDRVPGLADIQPERHDHADTGFRFDAAYQMTERWGLRSRFQRVEGESGHGHGEGESTHRFGSLGVGYTPLPPAGGRDWSLSLLGDMVYETFDYRGAESSIGEDGVGIEVGTAFQTTAGPLEHFVLKAVYGNSAASSAYAEFTADAEIAVNNHLGFFVEGIYRTHLPTDDVDRRKVQELLPGGLGGRVGLRATF